MILLQSRFRTRFHLFHDRQRPRSRFANKTNFVSLARIFANLWKTLCLRSTKHGKWEYSLREDSSRRQFVSPLFNMPPRGLALFTNAFYVFFYAPFLRVKPFLRFGKEVNLQTLISCRVSVPGSRIHPPFASIVLLIFPAFPTRSCRTNIDKIF